MYTLVNLLLQLERRKKNNLLSEEISRVQLLSYFFTTTIFFEKKNKQTKIWGTSYPQSLLNTVWLINISHFVFRACTEGRNLSWGDVVLGTDSQGKDIYFHSERQTMSRQGDNSRNVTPVKARMFEN